MKKYKLIKIKMLHILLHSVTRASVIQVGSKAGVIFAHLIRCRPSPDLTESGCLKFASLWGFIVHQPANVWLSY